MIETNSLGYPHTLLSIQSVMFDAYGHSRSTVLSGLQSLYEKGLISYPITECKYLPENKYEEARQMVHSVRLASGRTVQASPEARSYAWNDHLVTEHHGIVPTQAPAAAILFASFSELEFALYKEVTNAFLSMFGEVPETQKTGQTFLVSET